MGRRLDRRRNAIRFLDERHAYLFAEHVYAVTADGGRTWTIHGQPGPVDATTKVEAMKIDRVEIDPDGTGRMRRVPHFWQKSKSPATFETDDYGVTWIRTEHPG